MNMKARPDRQVECEIKLDLGDEEQYERLLKSLGSPKADITQANYFFDTSDSRLLGLHLALRVRISSETLAGKSECRTTAEITLKGPQEGAGALSRRNEINAELPLAVATASIAGGFDLTTLDVPPIAEVRKAIGAKKLIPLVSFRNRRLAFTPPPDCGCSFEVDLTTFGDNSTRHELEMEFPEPNEENTTRATEFVRKLLAELRIPYTPQPVSKFAVALSKRSLLA